MSVPAFLFVPAFLLITDGLAVSDYFTFDSFYYYYENHNFLKQTIYSSTRENSVGYSVLNHYDVFGSMNKQTEEPSKDVLMSVNQDDYNYRGQVKARKLNGSSNMVTNYQYYDSTGQISQISHGHLNGIQSFDYEYDAWGNIDSQRLNGSITEEFDYDELQRLVKSKVGNFAAIDYVYDDNGLGNLESKSDYSIEQKYEQTNFAGPNAITSAEVTGGTLYYTYDRKGNRIIDSLNSNQNRYKYDAHNLLIGSEKTIDSSYIDFRYGVNNQRYFKQEKSYDDFGALINDEITLYAGPKFEMIQNFATGETESKIHVNDYLTVTRKNNHLLKRHFLQKDRLGSTTQILDDSGAVVSTKGYDAFGKPRDGDTWGELMPPTLSFEEDPNSTLTTDITKRGFTDHEHLDAFELIHMNGRMYDFNNGRFLSVDPFIQGVTSQAINPYSYIQNNPLSGVDPTGYTAIHVARYLITQAPSAYRAVQTFKRLKKLSKAVDTATKVTSTRVAVVATTAAVVANDNKYEGKRNVTAEGVSAGFPQTDSSTATDNGLKPNVLMNEDTSDLGSQEEINSEDSSNSSGTNNEDPQNDPPEEKESKKERRKRFKKERKERKQNEPASEDKVKHEGKQLEKKHGKDAKRKFHDKKQKGEPDRSNKQIKEDKKDVDY